MSLEASRTKSFASLTRLCRPWSCLVLTVGALGAAPLGCTRPFLHELSGIAAATPPQLAVPTVQPQVAKPGTLLVVTVHTLGGAPRVTVAGQPAKLVQRTGDVYTYNYAVTGSEPEGAADVAVAAGNTAGLSTTHGSVLLVLHAPTVDAPVVSGSNLNAPYPGPGFVLTSPVHGVAPLSSCEVCVGTTAPCTSWSPAAITPSGCQSSPVVCADGAQLTLSMRATDAAGWQTTSSPLSLTCNTSLPTSTGVQAVPSLAGLVAARFFASATFVSQGGAPSACQVCVSTDGVCDTEWTAATLTGGLCAATGLMCQDGSSVTLGMRAANSAFSGWGNTPTLQLLCDGQGPVGAPLLPTHTADAGFVGPTFDLSTTFSDAHGLSLASCDVCVSSQGPCTSWQPATVSGSTCTALANPCSDGQALVLAMRGHDALGNVGNPVTASRICDGRVSSVGALTATGQASGGYVGATFNIGAPFGDAGGAGIVSCQVCSTTQSVCDGAWQAGTFSQGVCSSPANFTCPTHGSVLQLAARATDDVGNVGTTTLVTRICDTLAPTVTALSVGRAPAGGVQLSWAANDGGAGLASAPYTVYYQLDAPGTAGMGATQGNSPIPSVATASQVISGLAGCHRYFVGVAATDAVGNTSAASQGNISQGCGADGTFNSTSASIFGAAAMAQTLLGDFNGDAIVDQISIKPSLGHFGVRLGGGSNGRGDGTFGGVNNYTATAAPIVGTVGDYNGDNILDLALTEVGGSVEIWLGEGTGGAGDGNFVRQTTRYPVGSVPQAIVSGDFNLDHILDLAVISSGADKTLSILLGSGTGGRGTGAFSAPVNTTVVPGVSLIAADLDTDGVLDLITADPTGRGHVDFLHGNGDGTFAIAQAFNAASSGGANPNAVAVADFNGDAILDLVVANPGAAKVSVLLGGGSAGRGSGTFGTPTDFALLGAGAAVTVLTADVNSDGINDLIVCHNASPGVGVLLGTGAGGRGNGSFAPETLFSTQGYACTHVSLGDFHHGGLHDLLVADPNNTLVLSAGGYKGHGNGTFLPPYLLATAGFHNMPVVHDMNGDGMLDIVATTANPNAVSTQGYGVNILLGAGSSAKGTGSFGSEALFSSAALWMPSIADFNSDGIPDVACGGGGAGTLVTHLGGGANGVGNGTLAAASSVGAGSYGFGIVVGDLNGDRILDVSLSDGGLGSGTVYTGGGSAGRGNGVFTSAASTQICPGVAGQGLGDFNSDGILDIVAVCYNVGSSNNVYVLLGDGANGKANGTFTRTGPYSTGLQANSVVVADFNNDGVSDFATANAGDGTLSVLLGNGSNGVGSGTFAAATNYLLGGTGTGAIAASDVNGDGIVDLVATSGTSVVTFLGQGSNGRGAGAFAAPLIVAAGAPRWFTLGDVDADGIADVVVADGVSGGLSVLLGAGTYP